MTTKHTTGPWEFIAQNESNGIEKDFIGGTIISKDGGGEWHVAAIWNDVDEWEENARLIAAAPELLKALQDLYAFVTDPAHKIEVTGLSAISFIDINGRVKAAIEKATNA